MLTNPLNSVPRFASEVVSDHTAVEVFSPNIDARTGNVDPVPYPSRYTVSVESWPSVAVARGVGTIRGSESNEERGTASYTGMGDDSEPLVILGTLTVASIELPLPPASSRREKLRSYEPGRTITTC
jgi:hypothetical protein